MEQIKNKWDLTTIKKSLKGLGLAMTAAAAIEGLRFIGTIQISDPIITALVTIIVPAGINAINEYKSGK